ncbi:MAG: hypothetical protein F4227_08890 [Gammaproteobacteria bacterium]|nr:hypothetical protein [Gammaproteobacteria bacterium]MYF03066.1 hypothetical protein [Gammaproteobacteria bacterium]
MNLRTLWTLAIAEMRSIRRLARTWVFIAIAFLVCVLWYVGMLDMTSSPNPPVDWFHEQMNPRYRIALMMNMFVAIFSFGIIFLAFDIRARDVQNRMSDVVDALPATNIEIVIGRLFGILLLLLISCTLFLAVVAVYEVTSQLLGSPYRIGIQPLSVLSHLTWNIVPNLVFFGALVACLSTLVRIRLVVAIIAVGVLIGSLWVTDRIPILFQECLSLYIGSALFPSDLAPVFVTATIVGSRIAMLLVSVALLFFAASLLPRTEPRRNLNTVTGVAASAVGTLMIFGLVSSVWSDESRKEEWVTTHQEQTPSACPDIQHIEGEIVIQPGHKIKLDVKLTILPPMAKTADSVVFTLNPGYTIQKLFVDGEESFDFNFEAGLLIVSSKLFPDNSHELRLQAKGKLADRFAYLDQARNFQQLTHSSIPTLGLRNSIFHSDFVALMPGSIWLPISGSLTNLNNPEQQHRDLFTTDLTISVPRNWTVATVGKRRVVENAKFNTFRFISSAPVPELALLAANFDRRAMTIEGVEFEILFSKKHRENFDVLELVSERIQEFVAERIKNARALSLNYPYEAFYVVEVPSTLRIYGGGWRMASVLQPPGMMLVRETTFPTARFKNVVDSAYDQESESQDDQNEIIFNALLEYFGNDQQGGSPFIGFARNFVSHQVSAFQNGASVLQYVVDQLANQLITKHESCSIISLTEYGTGPRSLMINQSPEYHESNLATKRRMDIGTLPSTWDFMDEYALVDMDFNVYPVLSNRVLLAKGYALAKSMIAHYGAEKIGKFLEQLLNEYREMSFNLDDLIEVALSVEIDLNDWVVPWLKDTELPGYLTGTTKISKLEAPEFGESELQTTFTLHNAEAMPGVVRVVWSKGEFPMYQWGHGSFIYSDPILIRGHATKRFAIQSDTPLTGIWVDPFYARNRASIQLQLPENIESDSPTLPFVSGVEWQLTDAGESVVVDDLDPGFSIVKVGNEVEEFSFSKQVLRFSTGEDAYDQGLPVGNFPEAGRWDRIYHSASHGYYRRTHARIAQGNEASAARFTASLPRTGHWKLEFYVTDAAFMNVSYGISASIVLFEVQNQYKNRRANPNEPEEYYRLDIRDGQNEWKNEFDIANARAGWNDVGEFELNSTDIEVFLGDWAGHKDIMVHADAIRWTPVDSE